MTLAGKLEIRETQVRNIKLKIDPSEKTAKFTRKMDTLRLVLICSLIIGLTTCMIEGVAGANDDGLAVDLKMDMPSSTDLKVRYGDHDVDNGETLTQWNTKTAPSVLWSNADSEKEYTLIMVDPDAPSRKDAKYRSWFHWGVVNIAGKDLEKDGIGGGTELMSYSGPSPPSGTGPHRYALILFEQSSKVGTGLHNWERPSFNIGNFARERNMKAVTFVYYKVITM